MLTTEIAPYGSWKSPITSDLIVSETIGLAEIQIEGEDIYWIERRPAEGGRYVIVRRTTDGHSEEVTLSPFNARTRVHEYGGGGYLVAGDTIYFSNFSDQRLYRQQIGSSPQAITPAADLRYADGVYDRRRQRILCVREDHTEAGKEAANSIVDIAGRQASPAPDGGRVLVFGNDFYSSPRLSPDGSHLAWLTWNHPNMPWDGTELWVGEFREDGTLRQMQCLAGGKTESIIQPEWSPDGTLYFVSDRTGWWNLYRWQGGHVEPVFEMEAEFGSPQWVFGMFTYAFESADRIVCTYTRNGTWHLACIDTKTLTLENIETSYTEISCLRAKPGRAFFIAGSPREPLSVVQFDLTKPEIQVLRRSSSVSIDPGYISIPQVIEFPTELGRTAHALFYAPKNRDYIAPEGERPPLLVKSHGGPTAATSTQLNLGIQYWTSRGIAVLDVNYGGSSGYGRPYRERLNGQWGIVDVDDCVNGARCLVQQGKGDGNRLAIDGGSAGGYTTLCALTFRQVFKAGASFYGISDLEALEIDTHKFEARYSHSLVGPYPERRDLYRERSPIHFIDQISCPMILFQGLEDKVVPPSQSEMMFEAVRKKGLPVAYVAFEGEQHGFRRAENIKRALDGELYFYSKVFAFELADPVEPVKIENL